MFKKLYSSERVTTMHEKENNVLFNWVTHYVHNKTYGEGSGSTNEHGEQYNGNYGLICNSCNRIAEVRINTEMKSNVSMQSDTDIFLSSKVVYEGECPNCKIMSSFSIVPSYFADAVARLRNKGFIVGYNNDILNKRIYLNFSFRIENAYYKAVNKYIKSSFMFDLPLTWVFDYHSYKEFKNREFTWVSFRIYTDRCNLTEATIDIENFTKDICQLEYIHHNDLYWVIMRDVINVFTKPKYL